MYHLHMFVKHGFPQQEQSQNMAKFSESHILNPSHPKGMGCQWSMSNP